MKKNLIGALVILFLASFVRTAGAAYHFSSFRGRNPIHIFTKGVLPKGISPDVIKAVYHLPKRGGHGTIAIIGAYDDATIENDLRVFDKTFGLAECTTKNDCFEKHLISKNTKSNSGWNLETSLDIEWAHAIAPDAKILLVEAQTPSGANLLKAVDYAALRSDAVAISMSWGGAEFAEEKKMDSHFVSKSGAVFFASSGDNGWGASWPAASARVVAVGGTSLAFRSDGAFERETAWSGSGGGVSAYESQPAYQNGYSIPKAKGMRAIPDVSYDADPRSGFSVYANGAWYVLGGTSAGAPQWAAIQSLGLSATNKKLYADKASDAHATFFRDIVSGSNGDCVYYCRARKHYDYLTGLGSPITVNF
ncbi:S53 family peptidase [Patescibacteria group bacterium]|nr:S53 family peptidase [Patescibacteria group bacterium]